jgi:hypothetical protein
MSGRINFYLAVHGKKIYTDDDQNEEKAHPKHRTFCSKKCCPEQDYKRDQVKNNPRPYPGYIHTHPLFADGIIKYPTVHAIQTAFMWCYINPRSVCFFFKKNRLRLLNPIITVFI